MITAAILGFAWLVGFYPAWVGLRKHVKGRFTLKKRVVLTVFAVAWPIGVLAMWAEEYVDYLELD